MPRQSKIANISQKKQKEEYTDEESFGKDSENMKYVTKSSKKMKKDSKARDVDSVDNEDVLSRSTSRRGSGVERSTDVKDSSEISDFDENQEISDAFENYDNKKKKVSEDADNEVTDEYIQTVLLENVIKYIKLDDLIKEKQSEYKKEMKKIKDTKDNLEHYLIDYLDKMDEEYIQVGNKSTLIKTEVKTKAPPKMEDISVCLIDGFRKHEIYDDDEEIKRIVSDFVKTIDEKREVKTRKFLKRTKADNDKADGNKGRKKADNASAAPSRGSKSGRGGNDYFDDAHDVIDALDAPDNDNKTNRSAKAAPRHNKAIRN